MRRLTAIDTARLRLRPYAESDLDALHRLWTDPEVRRFLWDDAVISRDTAAQALRAGIATTAERGYGHWALCRREDPALIGFCGLAPMADDAAEIELLYGLDPAWWGRGYVTEAGCAWLQLAFTRFALPRVWALTDAPNVRSEAVMRRLGMRRVAAAAPAGPAYVRYVIAAGDAMPAAPCAVEEAP